MAFGALFVLYVVTILASYWPGFLSTDPLDQFQQALTGQYSDHHPLMFTLVWKLLFVFGKSPAPFLVLNTLLYGLAVWLLAKALRLKTWSKFVFALPLFFTPPIMAHLGTVWKDTFFGVLLFLSLALSFYANTHLKDRPRTFAHFLSLTLLVIATLVRHNGIFAAAPLGVYVLSSLQTRRLILTGLSYALALLLGFNLFFTFVIAPHKAHHGNLILLTDVLGASLISQKNEVPTLPIFSNLHELAQKQSSLDPIEIVNATRDSRYIRFPATNEERSELRTVWFDTLKNHPMDYLNYRLATFKQLLGLTPQVCMPFQYTLDQNPYGFTHSNNAFSQVILGLNFKLQNSPLFRGYIYLAISSLLLLSFVFLKGKISPPIMKLLIYTLLSSWFYIASLFFIGTACDFRMYWWSVLGVIFTMSSLCVLQLKTLKLRSN